MAADPLKRTLSGVVTHYVRLDTAREILGLNFRGGSVTSVTVQGAAAQFALLDPWGKAMQKAPAAAGLEAHSAALHAAVHDASSGELKVALPSGIKADSDGCVSVSIRYSIVGTNGALVFATDNATGEPYVYTKLRPGSSDEWLGLGSGARCVFPCIDRLATRCKYDISLRVAGADSDNAIVITKADGKDKRLPLAVFASGDPFPRNDVTDDGAHPSSQSPAYRFHMGTPVAPSAVGFVVAPLVRFERIESGPSASQNSWMTQLGLLRSQQQPQQPQQQAQSQSAASNNSATGLVSPSLLSGGAAPGSGDVTVTYHYSKQKRDHGECTHHARLGRRMIRFLSEWLDAPFPSRSHRHIYLPESVLPCEAALQAAPTGLGWPSALGGSAPGSPFSVTSAVTADVHPMLGLTLYPDTLLTSLAVVDSDATSHRAQVAGIASSWFGCAVGPASWEDSWLSHGLSSYVASQYLRSLRGDAEYQLDLSRASEAVARLDEQFPGLMPLSPRPLTTGNNPLVALSPQQRAYVACKAPAVIHMLAARVGEGAMQRALRLIVRQGMGLSTALAEVAAAAKLSAVELQTAVAEARGKGQQGGGVASGAASRESSLFLSPTSSASAAARVLSAPSSSSSASMGTSPAVSFAPAPAAPATSSIGGRPRQDSLSLDLAGMTGADILAATSNITTSATGAGAAGSGLFSPTIERLPSGGSQEVGGSIRTMTRARVTALTLVHLEHYRGMISVDAFLAVLQACCPRLPLPDPSAWAAAQGGSGHSAAAGASSPGQAHAAPSSSLSSIHAPPLLLCKPLIEFADQWIRDTGTPQLCVGVHVNRRTQRVELVVEQILRPGGRVFSGDLSVHIAERVEGEDGGGGGGHHGHSSLTGAVPPPYAATPEVWSYTFRVNQLRETFYPPCHTKLKRKSASESAAAILLPDTHRKKARGESGVKSKADPHAQLQELERRDTSDIDTDEVNDTPVLWVRVDPHGAWLKRLTLVAPAVMLATQLVREESVVGRIEALTALAALHSPLALYTPGQNDFDVYEHQAMPAVFFRPGGREDDVTKTALKRDVIASIVHTGYLLRPRRRQFVPCRLLSVALDLDPTHAGTGKEDDALAAVLGGSRGGKDGASAAVAAVGGKPKKSAKATAAAKRVGAPVGFNFRVRCAAAHALSTWASSRLPPLLPPAPPASTDGSSAAPAAVSANDPVVPEVFETYGGLAALLVLVKRLFYAPSDALPTSFSLTDEAAALALDNPATALPLLEAFASSGTPRLQPLTSLGDFELRRAAICALASMRHGDGSTVPPEQGTRHTEAATPLPVLLLLTRLLRGYDGGDASGLDDSPLLTSLVLGLGQAIVDAIPASAAAAIASDPDGPIAKRLAPLRAAMADGHAALTEAFAFQVAAIRQAPLSSSGGSSGVSSLAGTVAAACIASLALVESCRCGGAPVTLPLLRNYVSTMHPASGRPLPPRVRLAAFAGLARGFLMQAPLASASSAGGSGAPSPYAASADFFAAASALGGLSMRAFAPPQVGSPRLVYEPLEAAIGEQQALFLYLLHQRSDYELVSASDAAAPSAAANGVAPSVSAASVPSQDSLIVARLQTDIPRSLKSMNQQQLVDQLRQPPAKKRRGAGAGGGSDGSSSASNGLPPLGHWHADDILVDYGILDATSYSEERPTVYERRLYGALRFAPSSLGHLRFLADPLLALLPADSPFRAAAKAVATSVISALQASVASPSPSSLSFAPLAYHLAHSVWGLATPSALREGPDALSLPVQQALTSLAPAITVQANERWQSIRLRRDTLRERHVTLCLLLEHARKISADTSIWQATDADGLEGEGGLAVDGEEGAKMGVDGGGAEEAGAAGADVDGGVQGDSRGGQADGDGDFEEI